MNPQSTLRISALDTWFFRESRPMEAIGGSELSSVFPPPPRTVLGALRTAIGDADNINWGKDFKASHPLTQKIGFGNDLGPLRLDCLWLNHKQQRLYPMPGFLVYKETNTDIELDQLHIGAAVLTHLGKVRLPELPKDKQGFKPYAQAWLTEQGLHAVLQGKLPTPSDIYLAEKLFNPEARLGIARNHQTRTVEESALYQTQHIRPHADLSLEFTFTHSDNTTLPQGLVRLGGEGRLAHFEPIQTRPNLPTAPTANSHTQGLILILLSPAYFGPSQWLPDNFTNSKHHHNDVWQGTINNIELTVHAAVLGKSQREGGWNLVEHKPRDVQSLLPPGSAWYVTVNQGQSLQQAISALHGQRIGQDQDLGRGIIACGLWNDTESDTRT